MTADDQPDAEPRPTDLSPQQLGFSPQPPVGWLQPVQLSGTALRVILSHLFGAYLDKRELQNTLPTATRSGSTSSPTWATGSTPPTPSRTCWAGRA